MSEINKGAYTSDEITLYINHIPFHPYRKVHRKALKGKSNAACIKAKCLDCCNWQRVEVQNCPCNECPLWPRRPYGRKRDIAELKRSPEALCEQE